MLQVCMKIKWLQGEGVTHGIIYYIGDSIKMTWIGILSSSDTVSIIWKGAQFMRLV